MLANIEHKDKFYTVDLNQPIDISIPVQNGDANPNAFGIPHPSFEPIRIGNFVGSVAQGGSVNCENIFINPHGNGTHTECVGHIAKERITINQCLTRFFSLAQVISVALENNRVMSAAVIPKLDPAAESIIIRTLPNVTDKKLANYSGNDPAFLDPDLCHQLCMLGIKHLLIDLPSVDPEHDNGKLTAHHLFWNYPKAPRTDATITEMIFVPDAVADGLYILNIQIASFETDASPSKPILYKLA